MDAMPLTIKVTYGSDTRRITVPSTPSFSELHAMIKKMYKFSEEDIAVRYVDEDEELVRITCDEELEEAFQTLRKTRVAADRQLLRLYATKTGDEDPTASQLVQLLSSMSGPSLAQSVSQLNMLASLLQNPQVSQLLPALGRVQPSPASSPQPGSFEIPDWSRVEASSPGFSPISSASTLESVPKVPTAAEKAAATAEIDRLKTEMERLTATSPASHGGRPSQPYTVAGRPYAFNPTPRVVAEPASNPGPARPMERHQPVVAKASQPSAFDSFRFEAVDSDVPVEVEVPPLKAPIHPNIISPFPALSYGASRAVKEETIVAESEKDQLCFLGVQGEKETEASIDPVAALTQVAEKVTEKVAETVAEKAEEHVAEPVPEPVVQDAAKEEPKKTDEAVAEKTAPAVLATAEKKAPQASSSQKVKYQARFVRDLYVVDQQEMKPFEKFVRGWVMCNDGYAEWPVGTQMTWVAGDKLSATLQQSVPVVQPGETLEISMEMCAPGKPGRYVGYYRLSLPNGNRFGHRVWVDIMVKEPTPQFSMPSSSHFVPSPSAPAEVEVEVPARFAKVFDSLKVMGFSNKAQMISALEKHDGNIERALEELLQGMVQ